MYESPIHVFQGQLQMELEGEVLKAVQRIHVDVDKEELIRALKYDRDQYEKGFRDGVASAQKHGSWIGTQYDGYADGYPVYDTWECSCCHEEYESEGDPPSFDYCPGCGAKMDGDDHEQG